MRFWGWQGDEGGCGHYRIKFPFEALRLRGHTAAHGTRWVKEWQDVDVVVGQRIAAPGPSKLWAASTDKFRIFELDDDLWRIGAGNDASAYYGDPDVQELIRMNIQAADRVVTSTARLAERIHEETGHKDIRVLPNYIPERAIGVTELPEAFTVGWSGSPTHAADWNEWRSPLRQWLRRNPDARFHSIGAAYIPEAEFTGWLPVEENWRSLNFHVGLAPLRPSAFNQSKSAIKALEYAARGVPIIASDTGPYTEFVQHAYTGYLLRRPHELGGLLSNLKAGWSAGHFGNTQGLWSAHAHAQARQWTIEGHLDEIERTYTS